MSTNHAQKPVVPFSYQTTEIRTVTNQDQTIWFVANDVCCVLEIKNTTQAIDKLDDDERSMFHIGRQGSVNIINESGLYSLIFRTNKPEAKKFRKWVTSEVLPAIRQKGTYTTKLTPAQQRKIQELISKKVKDCNSTHQTEYGRIKSEFAVGTYKDIEADKFDELVKFIGVPQPKLPDKSDRFSDSAGDLFMHLGNALIELSSEKPVLQDISKAMLSALNMCESFPGQVNLRGYEF